MGEGYRLARASQTSRLLRELLKSRPEYRRQWEEQAERRRSNDVSLAGVARVIALYLWGAGERPDTDTTLARDIKDRVRRALGGENITPRTLGWFIDAFGLDTRDEASLWATFTGDSEPDAGISYTITSDRELALRQRHRTIALFERYVIAADRSFERRRTLHTIMALEDGIDVYPFNHEPAVERVEVVYGGAPGQRYVHGDGLHTDAVVLDHALRRGETASLEYIAHYPPGGYAATEVRRPAHGRSENIDIAVQFRARVTPRRLHWTVWQDHQDGDPVASELVELDQRHSARRFVRSIEETVVGFRWEWLRRLARYAP